MENLHVEIEQRINEMVGDVLVLVRRAASDAIHHALSGLPAAEGSRGRARKSPVKQPASKSYNRRTTEELAMLRDRLYQQIDEKPGEGMAVYAEALGIAARELGVIARRLKKEGRVRTIGERDGTRYFPMDQA